MASTDWAGACRIFPAGNYQYTQLMLSHFYRTTPLPAMKKHGIVSGCASFTKEFSGVTRIFFGRVSAASR
jgi:hypothetical protein